MLEDRIFSLNSYFKQCFGRKVYKISLDPGTTCPNRDGTLSFDGCAFCSAGGSGDFTPDCTLPIAEQLALAKARVAAKGADCFFGYFQAFTGTYGDASVLLSKYEAVLSDEQVVGLSIGTRPDCIPDALLCQIRALSDRYQKPVWLELGLQTANDGVAAAFNRGYPLEVFDDAVLRLSRLGLPCVVHLIIGLPTETLADLIASVDHVTALPIMGLKLQQLHILSGTKMAEWYAQTPEQFHFMELSEYLNALSVLIPRIPPHIVLHRLTGDGPKKLLIAPAYTGNKKQMLNQISRHFALEDLRQGSQCSNTKEEFHAAGSAHAL